MNNENDTIDPFDRTYGATLDISSLKSKPSTIETIEPLTGRVETFVTQTVRTDKGDYIFIKRMDNNGVVRMVIPPKVSGLIGNQKSALTKRSRSIRGRRVMRDRMASGDWKPPVPPRRKKA